MATIVLIHINGRVIPAVPSDVKPGDHFQWVREGDVGPMLIARSTPKAFPISAPVASSSTQWEIEAQPL